MTAPPRALYAAGLLTALIGALLVAWFVSGWADVRGRQRAVRDAPRIAAEQRGAELAHELRGELGAVLAREVERPYFHYQNLFHDPRASAGLSVAPSPLARGPDDPLVLGYFQLDARGRTTTPTINDELPELSEPRRLADNRRFRDEVARSLAAALGPPRAAGPLVAELVPVPGKLSSVQGAPRRRPGIASAGEPPATRAPVRPASPARPTTSPPLDQPAQAGQGAEAGQRAEAGQGTDAAQANEAQGNQLAQGNEPVLGDPPAQRNEQAVAQGQAQDRVAQAPQPQARQQAQIVTLDRDSYLQNNSSNSVYLNQQRAPRQAAQQRVEPRQAAPSQAGVPQVEPRQAVTRGAMPPPAVASQATPPAEPSQAATRPPAEPSQAPPQASAAGEAPSAPPEAGRARPRPDPELGRPAKVLRPSGSSAGASRPAPASAPEPAQPIAITVSPLEWRTLELSGQPAVVAVRQVETPDGRLAQGFVVDRTALTGWLAAHAGDAVAELRTGDNGSTEIVPGWHLEVAANPRAVVAAAGDATWVARGFVLRFVAVGAVAILVALLVVMLVVRAERLARERSQFAAAAAHELRTPLAGLQLYGDMLADGLGDPGKLRDYARRMSEEASRLGRVVSNVLGFSQLERGNLSIDARPGALGDALCELAERAQPALDRAGAVLALEVAPQLSATFDRDALARIVGNLLDNAEKYGRQSGDRTITLAAREAGSAVEIVVSDRGPGIAPPARARLFQPFARGVSADGPAGLGLGLALSQSLARAMGGELAHRPVPSGGAAFVLTLPRG